MQCISSLHTSKETQIHLWLYIPIQGGCRVFSMNVCLCITFWHPPHETVICWYTQKNIFNLKGIFYMVKVLHILWQDLTVYMKITLKDLSIHCRRSCQWFNCKYIQKCSTDSPDINFICQYSQIIKRDVQ